MRVALYAGIFKKNQDGATRSLYELVDSLLANDIETAVWGFSITPQKHKNLRLFKVPSVPLIGYPEYRLTLNNLNSDLELRRFKPDVVHVSVPDLVGVQFSWFARQQNLPLVYTFHTDFPSYLRYFKMGSLYHISWTLLKGFYNQGDAVFAPSDEYVGKLRSQGIERVRSWSRGIHTEHFNPGYRSEELRKSWKVTNEKVILYSGRLVWFKNLEAVIHVYKRFSEEQPGRVKFVIAGEGPIRQELENRMPEAHFTGHITGAQLSEAYASSDLFLFPSVTEAFGNVVLEALASGLPVVVSNVGGCQEIARKSGGGLITPADDPENFYRSCRTLLDDPLLFMKLRESGRTYASRQSWKTINQEIIGTYAELISSRPEEPPKTELFKPVIDLIRPNN